MGRKRKRKKRPEQPSAERAPEPVSDVPGTPDSQAVSRATETRPEADVTPVAVRPQDDDVVVEDLDADDGPASYESLVAAVAELQDDPAPTGRPAGGRGTPVARAAPPEVEEVHDLDDDSAPANVGRLIAQVGRAAPSVRKKSLDEENEEDVPVVDLDDDTAGPPAGPRVTAVFARPAPDLSKLARAAAVGGIDETDLPAVPIDFGEVSTPEARARLLAEALAHAEHKEARYRVPLPDERRMARWKGVAATAVLLLAGVVAVAPPAWVRPEPPAQLTEGARTRGIRLALLLQAQQVEAYRVSTQQLPQTLDELPEKLPGVRYTRSARSYQLVAFAPDGEPIVYDAAAPSPAFRVLAGSFADVEGGP